MTNHIMSRYSKQFNAISLNPPSSIEELHRLVLTHKVVLCVFTLNHKLMERTYFLDELEKLNIHDDSDS